MYAQVEASASTDTLDELDLKDDETIGNVIVSSSRRALHTRRLLAAVALLLSMLAGFTAGFFVRNSVANASVTADINDVSNSLVPAANQQSATQYVNSKHILHCGGSISEALANNCVFDSILQQWVPGPCFDREHHENFLKAHPRKWFSDSELQHEMSDSIGMPFASPFCDSSSRCAYADTCLAQSFLQISPAGRLSCRFHAIRLPQEALHLHMGDYGPSSPERKASSQRGYIVQAYPSL